MSSEHDKAVLNAIFNPLLPSETDIHDETFTLKDEEEENETVTSIKAIEKDGIEAAEKGELDEALRMFSEAVQRAPSRPSGYNNRAQVLRLKGEIEAALLDLNKAIDLSGGRGRSACQAFCQRGLILWKLGDNDRAKVDFEAAATLGSQFAKSQLVKLNPYAAMCNEMLQTVFNNLYA